MIAEKGRQGPRGCFPALVQHVSVERFGQHMRAFAAPQQIAHRRLEREIEHGGQCVAPGILRDIAVVRHVLVHLTEDMEIRDAARLGPRLHGGHEGLPEFGVHMARRIDAETVDAGSVDPVRIDIDHARQHMWMLGEQIVQSGKVAEA